MRTGKVVFFVTAAIFMSLAAFCSSYGAAAPGVLGFDFKSARELADEKDLPLAVIWGNPGCGFCSKLRSAISGADVTAWLKERGYVVVFAEGDSTARSFVKISGEYPLCRVVWKHKTGNNYEISRSFNGRLNKMPSQIGKSLGEQFKNTIDMYVGEFANVCLVDAVPSTSTGTVSGSGFAKVGDYVSLVAKPKSGYVLSGWYSSAGVRVSQDLTFDVRVIGSAQHFTASFIPKSADYANVACDLGSRYVTGVSDVNVPVRVDSGSKVASMKASALPPGLSFDPVSSAIVGTPAKSGIYAVSIQAKTAGGKTGTCTKNTAVVSPLERYVQVTCDAVKGRVTGTGVYARNRKVKISAKASAGWVFSGWRLNGEIVSQSASYTCPEGDEDVAYEAMFISTSDDRDSIALAIDGRDLIAGSELPLDVYCGVKTEMPVVPFALTLPSVSASGLPSGLKLVRDKETGTYAISGVPTKAGGLGTVKLSVKTEAKNTQTFVVQLTVRPLPLWAYGNFSGCYGDDLGNVKGTVELKISEKGAISGKVRSDAGVTKSFSVKGFDSVAEDGDSGLEFAFGTSVKAGPALRFVIGEFGVSGDVEQPYEVLCQMSLSQNVWLRKDLAVSLPPVATGKKQPVLQLNNGLTLKFAAKGVVKVSGKVNGSSVSGSAQMECLDSGVIGGGLRLRGRVPLCIPAKGKTQGFCGLLSVVLTDTDGDGQLDAAGLAEDETGMTP